MFHLSPDVRQRAFLTEEELRTMMEVPLRGKVLNLARDLFVFSCWTGLSFVDIKGLTKKSLVEHKGELWITSQRKKTKKPFQIKVLRPAADILRKYGRRKRNESGERKPDTGPFQHQDHPDLRQNHSYKAGQGFFSIQG